MRKWITLLLMVSYALTVTAQSGTVTGKVTDAKTGQALAGAVVRVKSTGGGAITANDGTYSISIKGNSATLIFSYVGYSDVSKTASAGSTLNVSMQESSSMGDEVVVSASLRPEKITRAPASISVITAKDFEQTASFNVGELASKIQGVEFVRTGVNGVGFNARGFNNAFNAKILQMTDGRNSMMAGGSGLPVGIMNTVIKEDIERFEVVLGPNSALYGPNAHNGIANTITKDPREYQGTTASSFSSCSFLRRLRSLLSFLFLFLLCFIKVAL